METSGEVTIGDKVFYYVAAVLLLALLVCLFVLVRHWRPARPAARFLRVLLGNVLLFFSLCLLLFLPMEFYYRYLYDTTDSFGMTRTTSRWFYRHYFVNNADVRDNVNYFFTLRPGKRRISFVGDSFTAGHGVAEVDDRFGNRVRAATEDKWDVHVLAEIGRDTGAEIELLKHLSQHGYQFDTIVLVYCLNDINDIIPEQQRVAERATEMIRRENLFLQHSFLLNTYYFRFKARFDPQVSSYYQHVRAAYAGPLWDEQQRRLDEFRESCEALNGRLLVVTFPFLHSLGDDYDFRPVHEALGRYWQERDVPHLDLLPQLEAHAREGLTVNRYDAHPNERAHALAAEAILEFLEGQM